MTKHGIGEPTVTVYNFRDLANGVESSAVSPFKATRKAILEVFRGDPIDATEEQVLPEDLDEMGRYRRLPTGWGDLAPR